jgi:carbon-monoxide dehydrogenase medium subunit
VSARDFFVDALTSAIEPGELLVNIAVPATGSHTAYLKLPNQASGFAMVGVAVALELDGAKCKSARIGVTGVGYTAFRAASVEAALAGKTLNKSTVEEAAEAVAGDIGDVMEDPLNGSAAYRQNLARVYVTRAVLAAMGT